MEIKRLISTLTILFSVSFLFAQVDDPKGKPVKETKTLLGTNHKIRGFGTIDAQVTEIQDEIALLTGTHFGVVVNNHFILGLGGYGITTNLRTEKPTNQDYNMKVKLRGGYGGLVLGYIIAPKEAVHISFPVLIGAGGLEEDAAARYREDFYEFYDTSGKSSAFFVVEPRAELELNITKSFKIGFNASYRFVDRLDLSTINSDEFSNFSYGISFKIGKF